MELHQVRYYIALCKTLNFTRAAALCNVTQPALTRAIQRLEEELGGPLFQRERNLTQLTELGRLMQPLLEQSLASAEAAKAHAQRFGRRELGSLRLGVAPGIALGAASPALAQVAERIPTLVVEIAADPQPRIVEKLLEGELDAAFLADDGALPERLTCWRLYTEGYRVAMTSEHALAAHEAVPAAALAGQAIVLRRDCTAAARLCEQQGAAGTGFRLQHRVDSNEHLLQLVAASLGLAIVPERLALAPSLVTRPLDGIELKRTVLLAVVNGRRFSPALDAFIRLIRARDFGAAA